MPGELSDRTEIRAVQFSKLQRMFAEILPANRFYGSKLDGIGAAPPETVEEFVQCVPFTSKSELIAAQKADPPFGTNLTYPVERYVRFSQTSATTTGRPMRWLDTAESWNWLVDCWMCVLNAAGITASDRLFCAFSFGPFLGFWVGFEAAERLGCMCIPGGGMRSSQRLSVILDTAATVLCCTPTYAIHLAQVAAEEGIDLRASKVRRIIVAGEPGGSIPAARAQMERMWPGSLVVDHHGMTEMGPVSYGCPVTPNLLHVIESEFVAEVIDPATGTALEAGSTGELVLTNLGRLGSPLIRYRTGDLVQTSTAGRCACGSAEMALPGGVLGRTDDMVVVRGVNVYPGALEEILRSCGGVAEYRVTIGENRGLAELGVEVEPDPQHLNDSGMAHRIEAALRDALQLRVPITMTAAGALPRFEMKAKRWVRSQP